MEENKMEENKNEFEMVKTKDKNKEKVGKFRKISNIFWVILICIIVAMISYNLAYYKIQSQLRQNEQILSIVDDLKKMIDENYLNEYEEEELIDGALKGYIAGLGDKYSQYYTQSEFEELCRELKGDYVGIGVYVGVSKNDEIVVLAPITGGPAEKAGILSGDILLRVDGEEINLDNYEEMIKKIRGTENTEVTIDILREDEEKTVVVKREKVVMYPVVSKILDNNVGYISLLSFDDSTTQEFVDKAQELKDKGVEKVIIDIRNNGGGALTSVREIAGTILPNQSLLLVQKDKNGQEEKTYTNRTPILDNCEIVLLVNENSASASEVLTGALRDYEKATVIGENTYGKGVVQEVKPLAQGGAIKLTVSEYFTPHGNKINGIGIKPDIEVKDEEYRTNMEVEKDKALQEALKFLNK